MCNQSRRAALASTRSTLSVELQCDTRTSTPLGDLAACAAKSHSSRALSVQQSKRPGVTNGSKFNQSANQSRVPFWHNKLRFFALFTKRASNCDPPRPGTIMMGERCLCVFVHTLNWGSIRRMMELGPIWLQQKRGTVHPSHWQINQSLLTYPAHSGGMKSAAKAAAAMTSPAYRMIHVD